jgi:hypothetical protein
MYPALVAALYSLKQGEVGRALKLVEARMVTQIASAELGLPRAFLSITSISCRKGKIMPNLCLRGITAVRLDG